MNTKKIVKIIVNTLLGAIFAFSLLTVILTLNTTEGVPNIFGTGYLTVQSDSMEPVFYEGDLIVVKVTSSDDEFFLQDIVTFRTIINGQQVLNTHEIVGKETVAGVILYTTKGANEDQNDLSTITSGDIVAKYTGTKLTGFGNIIDYVQSDTGFLLFVILPLAALFIYQVINFAILIANLKEKTEKAVASPDVNTLTDEQKEAIAKQYLEALNAKKTEDNSKE